MTALPHDADRTICITGELDFGSVPARLRQSADWLGQNQDQVIDLGGVTRADSAGIALLLDWIRQARKQGACLHFINAPTQVRSLVAFCSLEEVIDLQ